MRIAIIGTGYVGLVTGSCLAEVGHHVVCIDNDERKIKGLERLRYADDKPLVLEKSWIPAAQLP
jgi:UDP-glucose 6-dehydrogenase